MRLCLWLLGFQIDWMARPITENNTLEMVLKRPASSGDEIFTSFGARSNDDLFLYYGVYLHPKHCTLVLWRTFGRGPSLPEGPWA